MSEPTQRRRRNPVTSWFWNRRLRGLFFQALTLAVLGLLVWAIVVNTIDNLARAHIASGFDFLGRRAGFDMSQTPIDYSSDSSYGRAILVGILNTLIVAVCCIVTATVVGFAVGMGRLSKNWLVARLCFVYVEVFRNIPPLLVIFFWYIGVLAVLPQPRFSIALPFDTFLNNRGLVFPKPIPGEGSLTVAAVFLTAVVVAALFARWARLRKERTGRELPVAAISVLLVGGATAIAFVAMGSPLTFDRPVAGRFNLSGGMGVGPEFLSLYLALSIYSGSFIAEIVRSGLRGVAKGQTEAAQSLGLRPGRIARFVVVPQALRIIIPPLTSQYLSLTKNSSLAVAIGYSDLVSVGGTALNQTGQAVEIVTIWIAVYLSLSLVMSLFMNWFNAKMALVER